MQWLLYLPFYFFCLVASVAAYAKDLPNDLNWLTGNWQSTSQQGTFEERWSPLMQHNMLGSSRFVNKQGSATFFELMTIEPNQEQWDMRLMHFGPQLQLKHTKPIVYRLIQHSPDTLVFENTEHDPVRYLVYHHTSPTTLHVTLQTAEHKTKEQFKFKLISDKD